MSIVNFRITGIEASAGEKKNVEKVDVKSNFTISSMKKGKDTRIGDYLEVSFKFDVEYTPDVGKISLKGELWYHEKDLGKMILDEKKGKIALKGEASNEISTAVLHGSLLESIAIANKLRLPIPLKFPQVNIKQTRMEYKMAS